MFNYSSPRAIDELLRKRGFAPNKKLGQNFLVSHDVVRFLLSRVESSPHDRVWEIGPGIGTLSIGLAELCNSLTLFEIDRGFVDLLTEMHGGNAKVEIVSGDFAETWQTSRGTRDPDVIIGNLPYNAAARFIVELFDAAITSRMIFMVQRESARRMIAQPGDPTYSSYSIICQADWNIVRHRNLQPGSFYPAPGVVSSIVELETKGTEFLCPRRFILDVLRCLFSLRRKTIKNNIARCGLLKPLGMGTLHAILREFGIDPSARSEDLAPDLAIGLIERCFVALESQR